MKELEHLKRLSKVKSNSGIRFLTSAVSPGNHCPMRIASVISGDIEGLSSLLVGTPECTIHSRLFSPHPEGRRGELHWLYVLDSQEVVFGCRKGLIDALKQMDQAGAKAILLILTCVPELIGEDMEGLLHEIQPQLRARVTYVMLGQFKNISYPPGSWKTMEALGALMDKRQTDAKRVNVLGRAPEEEHIPAPSLLPALEQKGISLRYLAPGASLAEFQNAPDAALNLVVSPYAQPLAARMEREFGIPAVSLHTLYSVEEIQQAYHSVGEHFGLNFSGVFEEERKMALDLERQAKTKLAGLRYLISCRVDLPLPLSVYLSHLGMEPLLLHLEEFYPQDGEHVKKMNRLGYDPFVCRMVNLEDEVRILKDIGADLCLGYLPGKESIIPCVSEMFDFYGQTGYGRTAGILQRILTVAEKIREGGQ